MRENRFDPEGLLYISPKFHQSLAKSALQPGDLAVVRSGAVGVTCVIPESLPDANCSDLVLVQRPLGLVAQYGAYYMNSLAKRHVAAGKVGIALTHFNTKSVAALAVPLPPLAEQKRIVAEVERRLSVAEELEAVVAANLRRAARLRQAILQKAFSGKLVPQNPNDEFAPYQFDRVGTAPVITPRPQITRTAKEPQRMATEPIESLDELLERLDALGGESAPERLLIATGLGDDVEKFFDLLRSGRDAGNLSVPIGESGTIRSKRNAH